MNIHPPLSVSLPPLTHIHTHTNISLDRAVGNIVHAYYKSGPRFKSYYCRGRRPFRRWAGSVGSVAYDGAKWTHLIVFAWQGNILKNTPIHVLLFVLFYCVTMEHCRLYFCKVVEGLKTQKVKFDPFFPFLNFQHESKIFRGENSQCCHMKFYVFFSFFAKCHTLKGYFPVFISVIQ